MDRISDVFIVMVMLAVACTAWSQPPQRITQRFAFVDSEGVLRWRDSGEEVALFGVNYYAPFAYDFFYLQRLGLPIEQVIEQDVLHFARMGLDVIRLHVFDREVSDREGNLVDNEHLRLLDFLVAKAKERGIYVVLTPIAWWSTPNLSKGFSNFFTMQQLTTDPSAWEVQRRYLAHFVRHVNRYTGLAYKDDPTIIAFELINEPLYPAGTTDEQVRDYINALASAIRQIGCQKPLFYNGWDSRFAAVRNSIVDGCSFVWYPTGLVARRSLKGNFLPLVDDYPSMRDLGLRGKAKIVYEFDAADVPGSYIYPAMARAFRSGGAQIAAQFQYDPLPLAPYNVGWQTHYLNLVHAPNKAVSFAIAAEAFRRLPRLQTYGRYPENTRFGPFRVSYEEDLSEMVTEREFFYSNNTQTIPPNPAMLERIVGCGSSPLVRYEGTGAYFFDKLADGVWRLEVYPDAVWVNDPYSNPSLDRLVSVVFWRERRMQLRLPDLGEEFAVEPLNEGNTYRTQARKGAFVIRPGVYLLRRKGRTVKASSDWQLPVPIGLQEFAAPPSAHITTAWHEPVAHWREGKPLTIKITLASPQDPKRVTLYYRSGSEPRFRSVSMRQRRAYLYEVTLPTDALKPPKLEYFVGVQTDQPSKVLVLPFRWFGNPAELEKGLKLHLLVEAKPNERLPSVNYSGPSFYEAKVELVQGSCKGSWAWRLTATGFGEIPSSAGMRLPIVVPPSVPVGEWDLVVKARALYPQTRAVEVGLVERDGSAFGYDVPLSSAWREISVPLTYLRPLWGTKKPRLSVSNLSQISLVFGAWLYGQEREKPHGFEVEWIGLQPRLWALPVLPEEAPFVLFDAERHLVSPRSDVPVRTELVPGMHPDRIALRISVNRFNPPPSSVWFRNEARQELEPWQEHLAQCDTLLVRARAATSGTDQVELVLIERDGTPWGMNVPLSTEWQEIRVPLTALRHFAHWRVGRLDPRPPLRPENIAAVNVCFGAWLFPNCHAQPHAVEVEIIALERRREERR